MSAPWPGARPPWPPSAAPGVAPGVTGSTAGGVGPPVVARRGRLLARAALAVVLLAAAACGTGVFGALSATDVVSVDPVGPAIGWIVLAVAGMVGGVAGFLLAVVAVAWCRPRLLAAVALAAAVVLPAGAVTIGAVAGWAALKLHVAQDLSGDAPVLAAAGRDLLDAFGVSGPLRELLGRWASG